MSDYKKQHFVPQLLQRKFSKDGHNIASYNIERSTHFISPIATTAQKDWYYKANDKDKISIEKLYGSIEKEVSPTVGRINNGNFDLSVAESELLFLFSVAQLMRTPKATNAMGVILEFCKKRRIKVVCDEIDKGIRSEENLPMQSSLGLPAVLESMSGKSYVYLRNETSKSFVLSDNPAAIFSPVAEIAEEKHITDLMLVQESFSGYMLYLPLGPKVGVFFFDDDYYDLGADMVINITEQNVDFLNELQVRSANKILMYQDGTWDDNAMKGVLQYRQTNKFKRYQTTIYTPIESDFSLSFVNIDEDILVYKMNTMAVLKGRAI